MKIRTVKELTSYLRMAFIAFDCNGDYFGEIELDYHSRDYDGHAEKLKLFKEWNSRKHKVEDICYNKCCDRMDITFRFCE